MLENPTEAVSDMGYFDCIDSVMENSKVHCKSSHVVSYFAACCAGSVNDTDSIVFLDSYVWQCGVFCVQVLGEAMAGISHNAKNSNLPEFGDAVSSASKALCGLTEAAAQVNKHHSLWVHAVYVSVGFEFVCLLQRSKLLFPLMIHTSFLQPN